MNGLETGLDNLFKKFPPLPAGFRKGLATALPWLALAGGILTLFSLFAIYQAVIFVNSWVGFADSFYTSMGYSTATSGAGLFLWLSLGILVIQAMLILVAFPYLRKSKKIGWDLLFWSALVNVIYNVVYDLFSGYVNIGQLLFSLLGVIIALYFLFQVRPNFMGGGASLAAPVKPVDKK